MLPCSEVLWATAIKRLRESIPARYVAEWLQPASLFDYGCGYGKDVEFYCSLGIDAFGYDPHIGFVRTALPEGRLFDVVCVVYVLNILPRIDDRVSVISHAARFLHAHGRLFIATRNSRDVIAAARKGRWKQHNDGFWSNEKRGMFQSGIDDKDIRRYASLAGLCLADMPGKVPSGSTYALLRRGPNARMF